MIGNVFGNLVAGAVLPGAGTTYDTTFKDTDLVDGILTVVHGLNTSNPVTTVRRNDGVYEPFVQVTVSDANTITVDLTGFGVGTDPWSIHVSKN